MFLESDHKRRAVKILIPEMERRAGIAPAPEKTPNEEFLSKIQTFDDVSKFLKTHFEAYDTDVLLITMRNSLQHFPDRLKDPHYNRLLALTLLLTAMFQYPKAMGIHLRVNNLTKTTQLKDLYSPFHLAEVTCHLAHINQAAHQLKEYIERFLTQRIQRPLDQAEKDLIQRFCFVQKGGKLDVINGLSQAHQAIRQPKQVSGLLMERYRMELPFVPFDPELCQQIREVSLTAEDIKTLLKEPLTPQQEGRVSRIFLEMMGLEKEKPAVK